VNRFLKIWWIALAIKMVLAIWLPLSNDEAYYWVWGHHPQLSYFDHPPMIGWLFSIGTLFESFFNAARLPGVWLAHSTLLIWNQILKPHLDESSRVFWLVFALFSPFLGIGSLIMTPDIPLVFFWSLSIWMLVKTIETGSAKWYLALGAALGLGFCSKYMIVLFVPSALIWLSWSGQWRKVSLPKTLLTIVAGLIFSAPVLYWNWQNHWASFAFQIQHGLGAEKRKGIWPLEYLGAQIGLIFPIVLWFAVQRPARKSLRLLVCFAWFPIAFFFYTSFKARVEANWPIMAYPAILSLAVINAKNRRWLTATIGVWIVALAIVLSEVAYPWIPVDPRKLKTSEPHRFDALLPYAREIPDLYMGSYQMAAAVSYSMRKQFYKLDGMNRRDFYDFTPQSHPKGDKFSVAVETYFLFPDWLKKEGYEPGSSRQITNELTIIEVTRRAKDTDRK
jgi:4-amino-4-deoxy-L-arabinose transferase-like glycosyltransferase